MPIEFFQQKNKAEWDEFVLSSKNGTFLFLRDYMDYHSDRFLDYSMVVRKGGKIVALIPANIENDIVHSHKGLTYGGIVTSFAMTTTGFVTLFTEILDFLSRQGISKIIYKTVPAIYHKIPAEEDRYALFRANAKLTRRDILSVIHADHRVPEQKRRKRGASRAHKSGLEIQESHNWIDFWTVLEGRLKTSHQVTPVHSLDEIVRLKDLFPNNIRLFVASLSDDILAGCVIFHTGIVAHAQYIAASPEGQTKSALDLLFFRLINEEFRDTQYFDFGISNEENGRILNNGLVEFKEGFGARAIIHDHYELEL
jgi:hypothetical protein